MMGRTRASIYAHALAEYPRECCGLIVVCRGRERYIACHNASEHPDQQFVLPAREYADAEDLGEVVSIVHSHPDTPARPSEADLVQCELSGVPWVIVSVMPGGAGPVVDELRIVEPSGYQAPLVGRSWSHGVLDCWALVRDWYGRERGVELPNPSRVDGWWNDGTSDLYSDAALLAAGFSQVAMSEASPGDVLLMQIRSRNLVPNHAAVYLGDGLILHHLHGRLSSRDVFGGYWQDVVRSAWRYGP